MADVLTDLIRQVNSLQRKVDGLIKPEVPVWADWTPTVDQSGAVAATIVYARYITIGRLVLIEAGISITGSGGGNTTIAVGGIPSNIQPVNFGNVVDVRGIGYITATARYFVGIGINTADASQIIFRADQGANLGQNPAFTLANGDRIGFSAAWER